MKNIEIEFYREVKSDIEDFAQFAVEGIRDPKTKEHSGIKEAYSALNQVKLSGEDFQNLQKVIQDAIEGAVHSIFVSIDGGTALSDNGRALDLVNFETRESLTAGALHENFLEVFD